MSWRSGFGSVFLATSLAFAASVPAAAQQQACLQLEAQLAALERQNPQTAYNAIATQYNQARAQYDQAYRQAQQMGCIRFFQFNVPAACNATLAQLNNLQQQVATLEQQLRAADPSQYNANRANLLAALAANNCGAQYAPYANQNQGGLLNRIFGGGGQQLPGVPIQQAPLVTTYRTICARPCDGYYFPISFSTTPIQFEADQRTCEAQCPGATLYYHENPGAGVETAVSLNGQRYTALENAFAYREAYFPQCGCVPATTIVAEENDPQFTPITPETAAVIAETAALIPMPHLRPEPSEDPETIANRLGGFTPGGFTMNDADLTALLVTDDGLRLIGPAYLYAQ